MDCEEKKEKKTCNLCCWRTEHLCPGIVLEKEPQTIYDEPYEFYGFYGFYGFIPEEPVTIPVPDPLCPDHPAYETLTRYVHSADAYFKYGNLN